MAHKKGKRSDLNEFRKLNFETLYNLVYALKKYDKVPENLFMQVQFQSTEKIFIKLYIRRSIQHLQKAHSYNKIRS